MNVHEEGFLGQHVRTGQQAQRRCRTEENDQGSERIGTSEALRLLEETAKGPPSARLTRQARAVLTCLS